MEDQTVSEGKTLRRVKFKEISDDNFLRSALGRPPETAQVQARALHPSSSDAPFSAPDVLPVVEAPPFQLHSQLGQVSRWSPVMQFLQQRWAQLGESKYYVVALICFVLFSRLLVRTVALAGRLVIYSTRDAIAETVQVIKTEIVLAFGSLWNLVKEMEDVFITGIEVLIFGNAVPADRQGFAPHGPQPEVRLQGMREWQESGTPPQPEVRLPSMREWQAIPTQPSRVSLWTPFWTGVEASIGAMWLLRRYGVWWWSILAAKLGLEI